MTTNTMRERSVIRPDLHAAGGTRIALYVAGLIILAIVSRLPQLRSPNLLLDGDESVLGLMGRHAVRGEFPLFFWGQRYGLSTVEALAAAASGALFGTGALPLKAAMLGLWTVGVLFLFLALAGVVGARRSFWITAVFIVSPAWAVWSMKARGGYLTAFAATSMLLWVLVRSREQNTTLQWSVAGGLTALVFLAQPLWLPGILPMVVVAGLGSRRWISSFAAYVGVAAGAVLVCQRLAGPAPAAWSGPPLWNPDVIGTTVRVAQQIYVNTTGSYYLQSTIAPPGPATTVAAVAWCAVLPILLTIQVYRVVTRRFLRMSHVLFLGACATVLANWILLFARDARYMLPLSGLVVPLAGVELLDLFDRAIVSKAVVRGATIGALALGTASAVEFRAFNFLWTNRPNEWSESKRMQQVINALTSRGVHHVYSMNGLLNTQIMFYSDERVIARWASARDRHPEYVSEVDRARAAGLPVAVVGYTDASGAPGCWDIPICTGGLQTKVANPETIFTVDGKYFVYVGADTELLRQLHFELPE